jgi:xanthine dehydrogenase accessory factor
MSSVYNTIKASIEQERPVVAATIVAGPDHVGEHVLVFGSGHVEGTLGLPFNDAVIADATKQLNNGHPATREYSDGDRTYEVFLDPYVTPSDLYIFGGVHVGVPLCVFAKQIGFRVHVIDARERFGSADRFPLADEIATAFADDYLANVELGSTSYVVVLSHDPKLDDPALISALKSDARYIGAIGSRMTNEKRRLRLKNAGVTDEQMDRLHAPIGLNIGARNPEEIALSIIAEMIAAKNNMSRASLPRAKQPVEVSAGT